MQITRIAFEEYLSYDPSNEPVNVTPVIANDKRMFFSWTQFWIKTHLNPVMWK